MRKPPKMLVVEDNFVIRKLLVTVAQQAGLVTSEASNGVEALQMLREGNYDLVILDLMLPRLSGYEVLERLSRDLSDSGMEETRIIVVSAAGERDLHRSNPELVFDMVQKPFDIEHLKSVIAKACGWRTEEDRAKARAAGDAWRDSRPEGRSGHR